MANIKNTQLHPDGNKEIILHPETSFEQVVDGEDTVQNMIDEAIGGLTPITEVNAEAETLDEGAEATAVAAYKEQSLTLKFGIPKGVKGDKGDAGSDGEDGISTVSFSSFTVSVLPAIGGSVSIGVGYLSTVPKVGDNVIGIVIYTSSADVYNYLITGVVTEVGTYSAVATILTSVIIEYVSGAEITYESNVSEASATSETLEAGNQATAEVVINDKSLDFKFGIPKGDTGKNGTDGIDGINGLSFYHIAEELGVGEDVTTEVDDDAFTLPSGYEIVVGDLVLDEKGNVGQVTVVNETSATVRYMMSLKDGGATYRHNIAIYINRDDMDCCALSFTLINQDSSTSYAIPKNTTFAVSGIVYPNSSTAQVATRLTVNTSGDDTIYTVGYWMFPDAAQSTFEFTSNDTIIIEQTVEELSIGYKKYEAGENITISDDGVISASVPEYSAGNGIDITDDTITVKTVAHSFSNQVLIAIGAFSGSGLTYVGANTFTVTVSNDTYLMSFSFGTSITSASTLASALYNMGYNSSLIAFATLIYKANNFYLIRIFSSSTSYSSISGSIYKLQNYYLSDTGNTINGVDIS